MDKFFALPEEKKKNIIDAGFMTFGKVGYKKTSVNDIATAAGISKSMIFHYFGSKKEMYLYLMHLAEQNVIDAFTKHFETPTSDFFDRIMAGTQIKLSLIKKHPALYKFLMSVYFEDDPEVLDEIRAMMKKSDNFRSSFALSMLDFSKFKEGVKPELVLNILIKFAEGYVSALPSYEDLDFDALVAEFTECVQLMKNNFYKEDFK